MRKTFGQYMLTIIGALVIGFAVSLLSITGFGLDAFNSLIGNLVLITGLNFSTYSLLFGIFFVGLNTLVNKKTFNFYAIGISYIIGFSIDIFMPLLVNVGGNSALIFRIIWFVAGIMIYGLGVALLFKSDILSPLEEYMMAVKKMANTSVAKAKFLSDLLLVILALVVGFIGLSSFGQIGIGTIAITLVLGKVIDLYLKLFKKLEDRKIPIYRVSKVK